MTRWSPLMLALAQCALLGACSDAPASDLDAVSLRCEYLVNPQGMDISQPRLSWIGSSTLRGIFQNNSHIQVASSKSLLEEGKADLWDAEIHGGAQFAAYVGAPLSSHQVCWWRVKLQGALASSPQTVVKGDWSEPAQWSMGILNPEEWRARWISAGVVEQPLPLFRREFTLDKPIAKATLYACGLGFQEFRLNGAKVGDAILEPGWTNYKKTCIYSVNDVTTLLRDGANTLGAMLGNGMYNVTGGRYVKFTGSFGEPKLICQLRVEHADGTVTEIVSDDQWRTTPGPIIFSCIYGGEDYDARNELAGWDAPGFNASSWTPAGVVDGPGGILTSDGAPAIKAMERFPSKDWKEPKPGVFIYDMGRNCSGRPVFTVEGPAGAVVKMTPGELLDENGMVTQRSSGGPVWFSYTLQGGAPEEWTPRFTYYGYRYMQVEGAVPQDRAAEAKDLPVLHSLATDFTHSSATVAGRFQSSNETLNAVHNLILTAIRSNLQSVVTDCPHREKLGWLEVPHLLAGGLMYNFDMARFYSKIQRDIRDAQLENGLVPDIAPEYVVFNGGFRDSPEWGAVCALDPLYVNNFYGDNRLMTQYYDVMADYSRYLGTTAKDRIVSHGLGDWYDIGPKGPGVSQLTSLGLTATSFHHQVLDVLEQTARMMGKADEAAAWAAESSAVRDAFNATFYNTETKRYDRGSQTANAMPLVTGLTPESERAAVLDSLVKDIESNGYRVTAGDVGFSYVVRALTDAGRGDVLYKMALQDAGPGYVYQLQHGATSLTEAWDTNPHSSQNHCMLGHIEEWFYRGLAGIRPDVANPGFERFMLYPQTPEGLEWVEAQYDSVRGRIASAWRVASGNFQWRVSVPVNSVATLYIPATSPEGVTEQGVPAKDASGLTFLRMEDGRAVFEAGSGDYVLESSK